MSEAKTGHKPPAKPKEDETAEFLELLLRMPAPKSKSK
jgi:hypothetical protein